MRMSILVKARMNGFRERIFNGKKEKISHTLYGMLYKLHIGNVYHSKWLLCIKDILNSCGYLELWNNQVVENNFNLAKKVKQCCMNDFVNKWKELIFNSSKCLYYRIIKLNLVLKSILLLFHMI